MCVHTSEILQTEDLEAKDQVCEWAETEPNLSTVTSFSLYTGSYLGCSLVSVWDSAMGRRASHILLLQT